MHGDVSGRVGRVPRLALSLVLSALLMASMAPMAWASEDGDSGTAGSEQEAPSGVQVENGIKYGITTQGTATVVGLDDTSITDLVIPETLGGAPVTAIDSKAFYLNNHLKSVSLPEGITSIGDSAFGGCRKISNLILPDTIQSIGSQAFSSCSALVSVKLPSSLDTLGFASFSYCESLESISLPEGFKSLEGQTFKECTSLNTVSLPQSLQVIDYLDFSNCTQLASITLPTNLTRINFSAFSGCASLQRVSLPASVEYVGSGAFNGLARGSVVTVQTRSLYNKISSSLDSYLSTDRTTFSYEEGFPIEISSVTVSPSSLTMTVYQSEQLNATISPASVTDAEVSWSSSDTSVATVSSTGRVSAKQVGSATITASADGKSSSCIVTVVSDPSLSVRLYDDPLEITVSSRLTDKLTWKVSDGSVVQITDISNLSVSLPGYVSVTSTATVAPKSVGTSMVQAYAGSTLVYQVLVEVSPGGNLKDISDAVVSGLEESYALPDDNKSIEPKPVVIFEGTTLSEGTDYSLSYSNNDAVGTATIVITGKGRYTGTRRVQFEIVDSLTDISKAVVSNIEDSYPLRANNEPVQPKPTVTLGGNKLSEGVDYSLSYADNTTVGTASITITGIGNYEGMITVTFTIVESQNDIPYFPDVSATDWYYEYLTYVVSHGIMTGYTTPNSPTLFGPADNITRGQIATMLYRAANPSSVDTTDPGHYATTSAFLDVPSRTYYTAAINWCKERGIITGYMDGSGRFGPEDNVTREQFATMVCRFVASMGIGTSAVSSEFDSMPDRNQVSNYSAPSFAWCFDNGILTGRIEEEGVYLRPLDSATRAEAAKIFTIVLRDIIRME